MEQKFFAALHKNDDVYKHSSSGGAFTAITDMWFEKYQDKSVIYGCILDKSLKAVHVRATDKSKRNLMRGSKYISSDVSGVFEMVENDLREGLYVVFSGTPCQIAGLKSYLKSKGTEFSGKLLTVEVICHGVGSNKFFEDYISHLEKKKRSKAISCNFRAKSKPGKIQDMEVVFENGKKYNALSTRVDWFFSVYNKNIILRPSCYRCKYATKKRVSDISIADNWGDKESKLKKMRSLIIANTEYGLEAVKSAFSDMEFEYTSFDEIIQPQMLHPTPKAEIYGEFWQVYREHGYMAAQRYIGNNTLKGKVLYYTIYVLDRLKLIRILKKLKK